MVMPGETVASGASTKCPDCGDPLLMGALESGAGWFVGYYCNKWQCDCHPFSRESGYYPTKEACEAAIASGDFGRDQGYHPAELKVYELKRADE